VICKRNNRPENNNEMVCNGMRKKLEKITIQLPWEIVCARVAKSNKHDIAAEQ